MAVARKCDRCKSLYEIYDGIGFSDTNLNKWSSMKLCTHFTNDRYIEYDLCPNCMKALLSFINDGKKKVIPIIRKQCENCVHGQVEMGDVCIKCENYSNWEEYHE